MNIRHDPQRHRFYAVLDAGKAYLQYHPRGEKTLDYVSTLVPPEHRNHGIGAALVKKALDYARIEGYRIIPTCWFVARVIEQHPEYEKLIDQGSFE